MPHTVYAVYTEGWERFDPAILRQLFHSKGDAETFADELRNLEEVSWDGVTLNKTYYSVYVEELSIR